MGLGVAAFGELGGVGLSVDEQAGVVQVVAAQLAGVGIEVLQKLTGLLHVGMEGEVHGEILQLVDDH